MFFSILITSFTLVKSQKRWLLAADLLFDLEMREIWWSDIYNANLRFFLWGRLCWTEAAYKRWSRGRKERSVRIPCTAIMLGKHTQRRVKTFPAKCVTCFHGKLL